MDSDSAEGSPALLQLLITPTGMSPAQSSFLDPRQHSEIPQQKSCPLKEDSQQLYWAAAYMQGKQRFQVACPVSLCRYHPNPQGFTAPTAPSWLPLGLQLPGALSLQSYPQRSDRDNYIKGLKPQ